MTYTDWLEMMGMDEDMEVDYAPTMDAVGNSLKPTYTPRASANEIRNKGAEK